MKKLFVLWLCAILTVLPRLAWGDPVDEPVQAVPPGEDRIEAVKKGDPAPFDAQCFDQPTAIRWGNYLVQYKYRLKLDHGYLRALDEANDEYNKKLLQAEKDKYNDVVPKLEYENSELRRQLDNPPFYKTVWLGVVLGVVTTGALVALTAYGLDAASK